MNKPNIDNMLANVMVFIASVASMNWWFKFGDLVLDKLGMNNNAGNFKFREDMKFIWVMSCFFVSMLVCGWLQLVLFASAAWAVYVWR